MFTNRLSICIQPDEGVHLRFLLDALNGDASLFARSDEIELAWRFVDGIRAGWESEYGPPMLQYRPQTWGPRAANELLWRDGRWWVNDCGAHEGPQTHEYK